MVISYPEQLIVCFDLKQKISFGQVADPYLQSLSPSSFVKCNELYPRYYNGPDQNTYLLGRIKLTDLGALYRKYTTKLSTAIGSLFLRVIGSYLIQNYNKT